MLTVDVITDQAKGRLQTLSHSHRGPETNPDKYNQAIIKLALGM